MGTNGKPKNTFFGENLISSFLQFDAKKENLKKKGTKKGKPKNTFFGENLISSFLQLTQNKKTPKKSSTQKYLLQRKHLQFDTKKENLKKRYKKRKTKKYLLRRKPYFFISTIGRKIRKLQKSTKKWKTKKIPSSEETLFLHFYN